MNNKIKICSFSNKVHYKNSDHRKQVNHCKEVIIPFPFLTEMTQFPGKDPYCGSKKDNQECKKLDPQKHLVETALDKGRKVHDYAKYKNIKQVAELKYQGWKEPALVELMGFQVGIGNRENNYDEDDPENVIQYLIEICHIAGY